MLEGGIMFYTMAYNIILILYLRKVNKSQATIGGVGRNVSYSRNLSRNFSVLNINYTILSIF